MKKIWLILFLTLYFISAQIVYCDSSDYVLSYPSVMPGSKTYKLHLLWEKIMEYWYFGNFAQFKYNLNQADKYLVEAKTLFEYKQYLLAYQALKKSDQYFKKTKPYLEKARIEGKNVTQKESILKNASLKHIEILTFIKSFVPNEFIWTPEKSAPTRLNFQRTIEESISIKGKNL